MSFKHINCFSALYVCNPQYGFVHVYNHISLNMITAPTTPDRISSVDNGWMITAVMTASYKYLYTHLYIFKLNEIESFGEVILVLH